MPERKDKKEKEVLRKLFTKSRRTQFFHSAKPILIIFMITATLCGLFFLAIRKRTMFSEYSQIGGDSSFETIASPTQIFEQSFTSPYDILEGIQIQIGTFKRINNSEWIVILLDASTGKELYRWQQIAKSFEDNKYHYFRLPYPYSVKEDQEFLVLIHSFNVDASNSLAFYTSDVTSDGEYAVEGLHVNGSKTDKTLALRIIGGERSTKYWSSITVFFGIILFSFFFRIYHLRKNNIHVLRDTIIQSFIILFISSILFLPYIKMWHFNDEYDIFHAGIAMLNGKILYAEYVCQHPPATMFVAGFYALLGARSVETFRLMFYITIACIFGILYFRHRNNFKPVRLLLFFFFSITIVFPLYNKWMLGDVLASIGNLIILLEFFQFVKDKRITITRSIFISIGVYISFGSTFLSAFSIAWIVLMFTIYEINYWTKETLTVKLFINRYLMLVLIVSFPFLITFAYFGLNHALKEFVKQVYLFNREVYPYYNSGLGSSITSVIFSCISHFSALFADLVLSVTNGDIQLIDVFYLVTSGGFILTLVQMVINKQYLLAGSMLGYVIFSMTRGYEGFHAVGFAITIAAVSILKFDAKILQSKRSIPILYFTLACILIILGNSYYASIPDLFKDRQPINSNFYNLILQVLEENDGGYYIEYFTHDTLYLEHKIGPPVNRTPFMFPWYMSWYSSWALEDLDKASVVVYNPHTTVWGYKYSDFNRQFAWKLNSEFYRPDETGGYLWIRDSKNQYKE